MSRPQDATPFLFDMNPFEFVQQVRAETAKVTWPTRKETLVTTVMALIMVAFVAVFFLVVNQLLSWGIGSLIG